MIKKDLSSHQFKEKKIICLTVRHTTSGIQHKQTIHPGKNVSLAKPSSTFTPNRGRHRVLDTYIDFLPLEHIQVKQKRKFNLTNQELNAVNQSKKMTRVFHASFMDPEFPIF